MISRRVAGTLAAIVTLTAACGGGSSTTLAVTRTPSTLLIVSGNAQSGAPGEELTTPLVVRVLDSAGAPVQGQVVNFRVVTGGGSVFAGTAITDVNGMAQERWTLGPTSGLQTVEARAVDSRTGAAIVFATFTATAVNPCDNLQLAWTFTDASANPISCEQSGAAWILVFLDDQQIVDSQGNPLQLTCADGPVIPIAGVGPNPVKIQVDAYDANQNLLYQFIAPNVTARQCGNDVLTVDLKTVHGSLAIALTGLTLGCPIPGYVWYALTDLTTNQQYVVDQLHAPTSISCAATPNDVPLFDSLPFGPYRLDWIQVVTFDQSNHPVADAENCTPQQFNHGGDDVLTVPMTQPATTGCQ